MLNYILVFIYVYVLIGQQKDLAKELYDEYFGKGNKFHGRSMRKTMIWAGFTWNFIWPWLLLISIIEYFLNREWRYYNNR